MTIFFFCPACKTKSAAPEHAAGRNVKCPKCGIILAIPESAGKTQVSSAAAAEPPIPEAGAAKPLMKRPLVKVCQIAIGAPLIGCVQGVLMYFLLHYFLGPIIGGIGYGIGWMISAIFGPGILGLISLGLLLFLVIVAGYVSDLRSGWKERKQQGSSWMEGTFFALLSVFFCGLLFIGITYAAMNWEYGDGAKSAITHVGTVGCSVAWTLGFGYGIWFERLEFDHRASAVPATAGPSKREKIIMLGCGCVATILLVSFSIFGLIDEGGPGLICGVLSALILILLFVVNGGLLFFGLANWIVLDEKYRSDISSPPNPKTSPPSFSSGHAFVSAFSKTIIVISGVSLVGTVIVHDFYWYLNVGSADCVVGVTFAISNSIKNGDERTKLKEKLHTNESRWCLTALTARPPRWCLTEENTLLNRATLDIVGLIEGEKPGRFQLLDDHKLVKLGVHLLLQNNDVVLRETSTGINHAASAQRKVCMDKIWTYRWYTFLAERRERVIKGKC